MIIYDDLFVFITVFETKSFSLAAKALGISQPSISRRIHALEKSLGKPLVYTGANSIQFSEFGNQVYDFFKHKHREMNQLLNLLTTENKNVAGELRISLPIQLSYRLISPFLPEFIRKFPNLKLKINYNHNEPDLFDSGFDLAVSVIMPKQQSLIVRSLFNVQSGLYCTKQYAANHQLPQNILDLETHNFITYLRMDKASERHTVHWRNTLSGTEGSIELKQYLAINNQLNGLAILYTHEYIVALQDFEYIWHKQDLVAILPEYEYFDATFSKSLSQINYYLILPSKHKEPKINAFCAFLEECVNRYEQHKQDTGLSTEQNQQLSELKLSTAAY